MDLFVEIVSDFLEAVILLASFIILTNQNHFIKENKVKAMAFLTLFSMEEYLITYFLPDKYHSALIIASAIILMSYIGNIKLFNAGIICSVFVILVGVTEALIVVIEMSVFKVNYNSLAVHANYKAVLLLFSKSLQFIILWGLNKRKLNLTNFNIFKKEGSLYSFLILQVSTIVVLVYSINFVSLDSKSAIIYNIFVFVMCLIFFVIGFLDLRERERIIKINDKFKIQEHQMKNMEDITNIIREEKHDYANHINVINALCALNKPDTVERIQSYLATITEAIHTSFKLLDTGNDYIDGLLSIKSNYAFKKGIRFEVSINERFNSLNIRADELVSIISNLIDNAFEAFKATSQYDEKEISIITYLNENNFCIDIANNGEMIPFEMKNKIFEKGFSTKTKDTADHGFGLFIINELVKKNHGQIFVESDEVETVFSLRFKL
jgi:two-component system, LytTR family, sensor histidine kinase AgrC